MNEDTRPESLTAEERAELLRIARESIGAVLGRNPAPAAILSTPTLEAIGGAFVTLEMHGALRGCVGTAIPREPLGHAVAAMAKAAAFEDPRFPGLSAAELDELTIEISRLTPPRQARPDEVEPGRHGILITRGACRGLLLPQVAIRYGWDRETFLRETCHKAGLPADAWQDPKTEILVFEAEVFGEPGAGLNGG